MIVHLVVDGCDVALVWDEDGVDDVDVSVVALDVHGGDEGRVLLSAPDEWLDGVDGDLDWDLLAVDGVVWASVTGGADGVRDNVVGEDGGQLWDVLEEGCVDCNGVN